MVIFTCNGMTIEVTSDEALADILTYVQSDAMRQSILRQAEATPKGKPVLLTTMPFDALLDAVTERDREIVGIEEWADE